ncbi:MAG: hybrid sensor histidine kinase/response regulator [Paraburkholderia sp.]|uniref:hybrid sensor histidine kinase/response regulator n=1 Tax=Paraburkholderia sp. TaxID=1926495 RepID=UPI003C6B5516
MSSPPAVKRINRVLVILGPLICAAALGWGYAMYDLLLAPASFASTLGPQENHYWSVARFQIAALDAQEQILRYESGHGNDFDKVVGKFDVLRSRYDLLARRSDAADMLAALPSFKPTMQSLGGDLDRIEPLVDSPRDHPHNAGQLLPQFDKLKTDLSGMTFDIGQTEIASRDRIYSDFVRKRQHIFIASLSLAVLLIVLAGVAIAYDRRRRQIVAQQSAALAAEHRAHLAARDAMQAKNAFLGAVGHELRTPLQTIISAVDLLSDFHADDANRKVIVRLDRASRQLEAQMRDLTDYARLDAGKLALRPGHFRPAELLRSATEDLLEQATVKSLELTFSVADENIECVADANRVRQIVTNLLSNAIKYTARGAVDVALDHHISAAGATLLISVKDTGIGISENHFPDIFKPFIQISRANSQRHEGVGMGLSIVKGLVDLMGGRISVESELDHGTRFSVTLPVEIAAASQASPGDKRLTGFSDAVRALVVDDQAFSREAFQEMLTTLGVQCTVARDADEALSQLAAATFDVLLLDIQLPGKDGLQLAREIRSTTHSNQYAPIIWISALPPEANQPSETAPFEHYLMKPVRLDALRATLGMALQTTV